MEISIVPPRVNSVEFVLNPPEQPSQEIPKKDSEENGNMNTNAYIVVRYYKGNHKMTGFPISNFFLITQYPATSSNLGEFSSE